MLKIGEDIENQRAWFILIGAALLLIAAATWSYWSVLMCASSCVADITGTYSTQHPLYHLHVSDTLLNSWALGWEHHALLTPGTGLYDGNAFYPARLSLTGSEHMLGLSLPLLPFSMLGANPVWLHQITMYVACVGTSLVSFAFVYYLTGSSGAAFFAGVAAIVAPWRLAELPRVQLQATHYVLLTWLLLVAVLYESYSWKRVVALALAATAAFLSSYYIAWFTLLGIGVFGGVLVLYFRPGWPRVLASGIAIAAALGALYAVTGPYLAVHRGAGVLDPSAVYSPGFSGAWQLIRPASADTARLVGGAPPYRVPLSLFTLCVLSPVVLLTRRAAGRAQRPRIAPVTVGILLTMLAAFVLSAGNHAVLLGSRIRLPGYWLTEWLPGYGAMRGPQRWAIVIAVLAPVLASLTGWGIIRRVAGTFAGRGRVLGATLWMLPLAALLIEAPMTQIRVTDPLAWMDPSSDLNQAYHYLGSLAFGAIAEFPAPGRTDWEAEYMHASTIHWMPTVHGYTRYEPRSTRLIRRVIRDVPERRALVTLRRLVGVRWLVVHWERLAEAQRSRWIVAAGEGTILPVKIWDSVRLYELPVTKDASQWLNELVSPATREVTLTGRSREMLDVAEASGVLSAAPRQRYQLWGSGSASVELLVHIVNTGSAEWPSLDVDERGLVLIRAQLFDTDGSVVAASTELLGDDLSPGLRFVTKARFVLRAPVGHYRLRLDLVQRDHQYALHPLEGVSAVERTIEIIEGAGGRQCRGMGKAAAAG